MVCFLTDILEVIGLRIKSEAEECVDSTPWWQELGAIENPLNLS